MSSRSTEALDTLSAQCGPGKRETSELPATGTDSFEGSKTWHLGTRLNWFDQAGQIDTSWIGLCLCSPTTSPSCRHGQFHLSLW